MAKLPNNMNNDDISFIEIIHLFNSVFKYLIGKWKVILISGIIGTGIGATYTLVLKPNYIARLTFSVENEKSNPLGSYAGLASIAGIDIGNSGEGLFSSDNIISIMQSRRMIKNVLLSSISVNNKNKPLIEYYLSFNHINDDWPSVPELSKLRFEPNMNPKSLTRAQDSLINQIYSSIIKSALTIDKPDKKLSLIEATCTSKNENFSKKFIETLCDKVTDFYINTKTKRQKENVDVLQSKADSLYKILSNTMVRSATLADQNQNLSKQLGSVERLRKQLDIQVATTAYGEVIKNLEIAKITLLKETPLIQVIDQPVFPLKKEEVSLLKGIVIGGFLFSFITIIYLLALQYFKKLLSKKKEDQ